MQCNAMQNKAIQCNAIGKEVWNKTIIMWLQKYKGEKGAMAAIQKHQSDLKILGPDPL